MPTANGLCFPKADSVNRQERLMSEWGLSKFVLGITSWCDGTFFINRERTKCFIHGYYCELSSSQDSYIKVVVTDGWFQAVQGPFTGSSIEEGTYNISVTDAPCFDTAEHFIEALLANYEQGLSPFYIVSASEPTSRGDLKKIWIKADNFNPYIYYNGIWTPLGAVYK